MIRRLLHACWPALLAGCTAPVAPPVASTPMVVTPAEVPVADVPVVDAAVANVPVVAAAAVDVPVMVEVPVVDVPVATAEEVKVDVAAMPASSAFHVAAYRDGVMLLHEVGGEVFVSGGGGLAQLDARGDRLVNVEYGLSGQSDPGWAFEDWDVVSFGGVWPDNVWLTTIAGMSRASTPPLLHRREGSLWKPQKTRDAMLHLAYVAVVNGAGGQVLGVREYQVDPDYFDGGGEEDPARDRRIKRARARLQSGIDVLGPTTTPSSMVMAPDLSPLTAATAPTGELFMLARAGGNYMDKPRVQRWGLEGAAAVTGKVDALPGGFECDQIAVRAADEAYVGCHRSGEMRLSRFDGERWSDEPAPKVTSIADLAVAPSGELYVVSDDMGDGTLWRRAARGAAWEEVTLPEVRFADLAAPEWNYDAVREEIRLRPADPEAAAKTWPVYVTSVLARADGELWVVGSARVVRAERDEFWPHRRVVLRNRAMAEPLRMLAGGDMVTELFDWRAAEPWTPAGCKRDWGPNFAFVAMRSLPPNAPRNLPEPMVETFVKENAALMGQVTRIAEVFRRGRRTVGMFVEPTDQAGADALLAAIDRVAPGEKRTIECRMPRIRREFDRTTGEALQAPAI